MIEIIIFIVILLIYFLDEFVEKIYRLVIFPTRYNYSVIGGGLAGLLAAYKIKTSDPTRTVIVYEAERWGSRAYSIKWHDTNIKLGAGIIRPIDKQLLALCKQLNIKVGSFYNDVSYRWQSPTPLAQSQIPELIQTVKNTYQNNLLDCQSIDFTTFLDRYLPEKKQLIIRHLGYTDMLNASTPDVIYHYPVSDMFVDETRYYIDWNELIAKLQIPGIVYRKQKIHNVDDLNTEQIVLAVEKNGFSNLINNSPSLKPLRKIEEAIGTVPFIRAFCYTDKVSLPGITLTDKVSLPGITLTDLQVQRVVKFNDQVTMCIYADNQNAEYWQEQIKMNTIQASALSQLRTLYPNFPNFKDFIHHYWKIGIHYYKPIKREPEANWRQKWIQSVNHYNNIYIVGEMLSLSQGWVEGVVESVNLVNFQ